jgi:hypothetical protein
MCAEGRHKRHRNNVFIHVILLACTPQVLYRVDLSNSCKSFRFVAQDLHVCTVSIHHNVTQLMLFRTMDVPRVYLWYLDDLYINRVHFPQNNILCQSLGDLTGRGPLICQMPFGVHDNSPSDLRQLSLLIVTHIRTLYALLLFGVLSRQGTYFVTMFILTSLRRTWVIASVRGSWAWIRIRLLSAASWLPGTWSVSIIAIVIELLCTLGQQNNMSYTHGWNCCSRLIITLRYIIAQQPWCKQNKKHMQVYNIVDRTCMAH